MPEFIERLRERIEERPLLRKIRERVEEFRGQYVGVTPEKLTEAQKRLMEEFRRGIASALGVPPEAIREDVLQKWIIEWTKAWVKPEYWRAMKVRASVAYDLGYELGRIVKSQYAEAQKTETSSPEVSESAEEGGRLY